MARRKKSSSDAPTSIRLSVDLKEALREEGRLDQKQNGGPPRSLHYVIVSALKDFIARRREQRSATEQT